MNIMHNINNYGIFNRKSLYNVKTMLTDPITVSIISQYPINEMDLKHRIYMYTMKCKLVLLVMLFTKAIA